MKHSENPTEEMSDFTNLYKTYYKLDKDIEFLNDMGSLAEKTG
ncbi:hypothetical protein [Filobacillus milosensis]|nr:hypothetical protein [Filobacillus milosensis]